MAELQNPVPRALTLLGMAGFSGGLLVLWGGAAAAALGSTAVAVALLGLLATRRLGGVSGDVLGASLEIGRLAALLGYLSAPFLQPFL